MELIKSNNICSCLSLLLDDISTNGHTNINWLIKNETAGVYPWTDGFPNFNSWEKNIMDWGLNFISNIKDLGLRRLYKFIIKRVMGR